MNKVVKLRPAPEPVEYKGRKRYIGWSTAAVGESLIKKKLGPHYTSTGEIARDFYCRDADGLRAKVRRNVSTLRRWLADRNEFLLVQFTSARMIAALKVCNPADENDRLAAVQRLLNLEAREEITHAERVRWEDLLFLPKDSPEGESGGTEQE